MAIRNRENEEYRKPEIDLAGPDGNAFALMRQVQVTGRQLGWSEDKIDSVIEEMKSSDYANVIEVFDRELGEYIDLIR